MTTDSNAQIELKKTLQAEIDPRKLEHMVAALIGELLQLPIAVARSGFQHGGDAGPAGRQGRRFRIECKKYRDKSSLNERELLGEIDHALLRDPALEAWILVVTRSVNENITQAMSLKGERVGIPVIIIDWTDNLLAPLAALCASAPTIVGEWFGPAAEEHAQALHKSAQSAVQMLRRDLTSWSPGFETLRKASHDRLQAIWDDPRQSQSDLGQDAAGGHHQKIIRRIAVHEGLDTWWETTGTSDAPAAIVGLEGVGKTWATLHWLIETKQQQGIVLLIPSSALSAEFIATESAIKALIASRFHELTGVRDQLYWEHRLERLLDRPVEEGPLLTLAFDGVNQEPSAPWLQVLKVLQSPRLSARIRIIISTRNHYFKERLARLRGLVQAAVPIAIGAYSTEPGGELDQMLALEGLARTELHADLVELASTPRLFKLVIRFRQQLLASGQITLHRLLWEYGRDSFGERTETSFSEAEWREWLAAVAGQHREGMQGLTQKDLAETTNRPDLSETEVYARLSSIIDGQFVEKNASGHFELVPHIVTHALGAALLTHLDQIKPEFLTQQTELEKWLDPIAAMDEPTEILRAAISIILERDQPSNPTLTSVLLTAWLQSQNIPDEHRRELQALAPALVNPLLDVIEQSASHNHRSARLWAVNALRAVPRNNAEAGQLVINRLCQWFAAVFRDVRLRHDFPDEKEQEREQRIDGERQSEQQRSQWFIDKIGIDEPGEVKVLDIPIQLVDQDPDLAVLAPSLLEGYPLANTGTLFQTAVIAHAIDRSNHWWRKLGWLILFNEIDPKQTLRKLHDDSKAMLSRQIESGINSKLPARTAALLLWLTGEDADENAALVISPTMDQYFSYQEHYLNKPNRSLFQLEKRHAHLVLEDMEQHIVRRADRTKRFWLSPDFSASTAFVEELRIAAERVDVTKLNSSIFSEMTEHDFSDLKIALARFLPEALAELIRKETQKLDICDASSRYWKAIASMNRFLVIGPSEAKTARLLRLSRAENDKINEAFAANKLLILEIRDLNAIDQAKIIIESELSSISLSLSYVIRSLSSVEVDRLIKQYTDTSQHRQDNLLIILSFQQLSLSPLAWAWVEALANLGDYQYQSIAFQVLLTTDACRFGEMLLMQQWTWNPAQKLEINHYGSLAIIEATRSKPFNEQVSRIAPWRLLEAARLRGNKPRELRLAAEIFDRVIRNNLGNPPSLDVTLSVDRTTLDEDPFSFSMVPIEEETNDLAKIIANNLDIQKIRQISKTAITQIEAARQSGARLYLLNVQKQDLEAVAQHFEAFIDGWIEGYKNCSAAFRRRVHLSEGVFWALCETLLALIPDKGAELWRALRQVEVIRYLGAGGVDDLIHMAFRAPDSPKVIELRDELIELDNCNTDEALFHLAFVATYNGKTDWLKEQINLDTASEKSWIQKRALVLHGFTSYNTLPINDVWPDSEVKTYYKKLAFRSAHFRFS